jgi:hypothetical protein
MSVRTYRRMRFIRMMKKGRKSGRVIPPLFFAREKVMFQTQKGPH